MKMEFLHHYKKKHGYTLKDKLIARLPDYARGVPPPRLAAESAQPQSGCWRAWARSCWAFRRGAACRPGSRKHFFNDAPTHGHARGSAGRRQGRWCCSSTPSTASSNPPTRAPPLAVLQAAGYTVHVAAKSRPDGKHLCCGRTYLASGMVDEARAKAREADDSLAAVRRNGHRHRRAGAVLPVDAARRDAGPWAWATPAQVVAAQALLFEEFLARESQAGRLETCARSCDRWTSACCCTATATRKRSAR